MVGVPGGAQAAALGDTLATLATAKPTALYVQNTPLKRKEKEWKKIIYIYFNKVEIR